MRRNSIYCIMITFILTTSINAQEYTITVSNNPSFENWTNGLPDDWLVKFDPSTTSISQSTDADTGNYAIEINMKSTNFEVISFTQNVSAIPNTKYEFSVVFKGTLVVDSELFFGWSWFDGSGFQIIENLGPGKMIISEKTTFDYYLGFIQRPISPANTTSMLLTFNLFTNNADAIIDDFIVSYSSDDPPVTTTIKSETKSVTPTSENLTSKLSEETNSTENINENQSNDNSIDFTENLFLLFSYLLIIRIIIKKIRKQVTINSFLH